MWQNGHGLIVMDNDMDVNELDGMDCNPSHQLLQDAGARSKVRHHGPLHRTDHTRTMFCFVPVILEVDLYGPEVRLVILRLDKERGIIQQQKMQPKEN